MKEGWTGGGGTPATRSVSQGRETGSASLGSFQFRLFDPDIVALDQLIDRLPDGRTLVVESKGAHLWEASEDDRRIGRLWEEMSEGRCLFIMVTAGQLGMIDLKLKPAV